VVPVLYYSCECLTFMRTVQVLILLWSSIIFDQCLHVLAHKKQTPEEEDDLLVGYSGGLDSFTHPARIFFVPLICVEIEGDVLSHIN
jgi:hypothetical protein